MYPPVIEHRPPALSFSSAHPRAAVIFDNLHMMHDIISDILTADTVPYSRKGEMIDRQLDKLQDPTRDVMTLDEWRAMTEHMGGAQAMGGPATGLLVDLSDHTAQTRKSAPDTMEQGERGGVQHERGGTRPDSTTPHETQHQH